MKTMTANTIVTTIWLPLGVVTTVNLTSPRRITLPDRPRNDSFHQIGPQGHEVVNPFRLSEGKDANKTLFIEQK